MGTGVRVGRVAAWALSVLVSACAPTSTRPAASRPAESTPASTDRAAELPRLDPLKEAQLAQMQRLADWRNIALAQGQPPKTKQAIRSSGAFPYSAIASARAYTFGRTPFDIPCESSEDLAPFAKDGFLCPDVVLPPADLSPAQLQAVLHSLRVQDGKHRMVLRCGFDAHHVLVFYDARGVAIAKLLVCFTCGEVQAFPPIPALGGTEPGTMTSFESVLEVFDQAGLTPWAYGNDELWQYRRTRDEARSRQTPSSQQVPPEATLDSGVSSEKPSFSLSQQERDRVWLAYLAALAEAASGSEPRSPEFLRNGAGIECQSGRQISLAYTAHCPELPRQCAAPVAQVENCLRTLTWKVREICERPHPECAAIFECLPCVTWREPASAAHHL